MNIVKSDRKAPSRSSVMSNQHMKYAQDCIYSSIKELGSIAEGREDIKNSIADLSVVLFDLKSMDNKT